MTKKEKEELERKQKKNSKAKSLAILILVVLLIAVIAFFLFKEGIIPSGKEESSVSDPANSVSDTIDYSDSSNSNSNSQASENKTEDESSGEEPSSDNNDANEAETPNHNDGSVYSASLPLTVDDALAILNSRYGKEYRINMSTSGNGYNNFAVFKDDERYATVSVNLSTGDATEIIMDTGNQTKFNLLK